MPASPDLSPLETATGIHFENRSLLERVFIHRSYLNEHPGANSEHNERLEFLGDAVLELIVTEYLYKTLESREGELTNLRSALVRGQHLAELALSLDFGTYLMLSRGEEKSGGKEKHLLLANTFEAYVGAIYLEHGYDVAKKFVTDTVLAQLPKILEENRHIDPKGRFQELAQEQIGLTPTYRVLSDTGPDHDKNFVVGAYIGSVLVGQGEGSSKQRGQTKAAENALANQATWPPSR